MLTLVPGGASSVQLKSNGPKTYAYVDSLGLTQDERRRLSVIVACKIKRSHSCNGKSGSQVARPAKKWFLKVRIALSAALRWCIFGGANLNVFLCFVKAYFSSLLHSLSRIFFL